MAQQELPWMPGPDAPGMVLLNPEGTRHLSFDMGRGDWLRLFENGRHQSLSVSEAIRLRPSDVDTIIRWTMVFCLENGSEDRRVNDLIDDLADGLKATIAYLVQRAGMQ